MRWAVLLAALGLGCGAPPPDCPPEPTHEFGAPQCVSDGCGLEKLSWESLDCHQLWTAQTWEDCSIHAEFRCANGLDAVLVYDGDEARITVRGDECTTRYTLAPAGTAVDCASAGTDEGLIESP